MINIAICDNDLKVCNKLFNYIASHFVSIVDNIEDFTNGIELLDSIYNGELYNIIILGNKMSPIDGISTANIIRTLPKYNNTFIFFTSAQNMHTSALTDTHAYAYIRKPIDINFFHKSFSSALNTLDDRPKHTTIMQKYGTLNIDTDNIIYIESLNSGKCIVHLQNTSILHRGTLSSLIKEISITSQTFIRTHTSYVINLLYLKEFTKNGIVLSNGVFVPVGSRYRNHIIKEYHINFKH